MALKRITVTIPQEVLEDADRKAEELDRSRSWIVAEAVRGYVTEVPGAAPVKPTLVREPAPHPYAAAEVAAARRRHIEAELALSPAERLKRAEKLVGLARKLHPRPRRLQVIGFESYEDYYEWKKRSLIAG